MNYTKRFLSVEQQTEQLISRGLVADRVVLAARLKVVNYYRLSGYLYRFRAFDSDTGKRTEQFVAGTTLNAVWRLYCFDRRLRLLLLDAIERIEVAVRTRLIYRFVEKHGPFGHLEQANLPGFKSAEHHSWLQKLQMEKRRSREEFVRHFDKTYAADRQDALPLWMACELMTCDTTLKFAYGLHPSVLREVAADFDFPDQQLLSWSKAVFALRNACAHHSRIWNRTVGAKPSVPNKNKNPHWHATPSFANDRIGLLLTVCCNWLGKITATSSWRERLFALFAEYPEIPLSEMGIPPEWQNHPLWR